MTGTARGPEKRTRRAGGRFPEDKSGTNGTLMGSPETGGTLEGQGADENFGRAQAMLRMSVERTADEIKELHRELSDLGDDELKRIPILAEGTRLEQGATYLDLQDADRAAFTARGHERVGADNWIVAKAQVDYGLWNRLRRVERPDALRGQPKEGLH